MKFDAILIGGGLSSLVCGIRLQKAGKKCLIVSAGQNALHFSSGTFGLLGRLPDGKIVASPFAAMSSLPAEHPYSKIGTLQVKEYADSTIPFFAENGIQLKGFGSRNGFRLTATGTLKPAWLALKDVTFLESKDEVIGSKALIVNFAGFLDFNTSFIAEGLEKMGLSCRIEAVSLPEVERLRKSPTEMRSVNISRVMGREENWKEFGHKVQSMIKDEDVVVLPEVFGIGNPQIPGWVSEMINAKVIFVGTMPPSVPGIRTQMLLKKAFEQAGGTFLMGDEAVSPTFERSYVKSIRTVNMGRNEILADNFILASGHLFGKGLVAGPGTIAEPVFGLDTDFSENRTDWYDSDFFARQRYMGYGVRTDSSFKAFRNGALVDNLYVIGAELGGCNSIYEGSGAGVAIMTAFKVADEILKG